MNGSTYGYWANPVPSYQVFSAYQSGTPVSWTASDANSVAAAVTFSNTTGRYPAYTKTSAGPGGYTQTFLDPSTYLGVQFLSTLEAAGQYPV